MPLIFDFSRSSSLILGIGSVTVFLSTLISEPKLILIFFFLEIALKVEDISEPRCKPGKVKVKIQSSSLNHLDIWVRKGLPRMKLPLPLILGSDGAGTIIEIGAGIKEWKIGDDVVIQPGTYEKDCSMVKKGKENFSKTYGILGETENGVQCEYAVLYPYNIYPKPKHLSFIEAASMPLVFMTAYQMLIKRALLNASETVLIYGATSGIGTAAIQIAKDIGAHIITTVGSESKFDYAFKFGADHVFNHSDPDCLLQIKKKLKKNKIDVIFEHVGLKTWDMSMRLLANGGRLVTCGATTGYNVNINLRHLFSKQQSIIGSTISEKDAFKQVQKKNKDEYI